MKTYYRVVAIALVASSLLILGAVCAKAEGAGTYSDAMRQCGKEWRASDARKSVSKGQGAAAWQAFRKECTTRVGYAKKPRASVGRGQ